MPNLSLIHILFNEVHGINTALTYHISKLTRNQVENPLCQQNVNWTGSYTYDNKYTLQAAVTFAGTQSLISSYQYQFFPSVGASWIISDEQFMKNLKFINFLKLRAEYGELGYQSLNPTLFMYEDKWSVNNTGTASVSYTHLDVYKRQIISSLLSGMGFGAGSGSGLSGCVRRSPGGSTE